VDLVGDEHMGADRRHQRTQLEGGAADPAGHGRAGKLDTFTGIDPCLPVERQVIAIFADQHMGEQTGTRPAALDGQVGRRGLMDRLARAARDLGAHMLDHLEVAGHIFQHFALVLAKHPHLAAARRTSRRRRMRDGLARQVLRQLAAGRFALLVRHGGR
jgi:hypothetical protein